MTLTPTPSSGWNGNQEYRTVHIEGRDIVRPSMLPGIVAYALGIRPRPRERIEHTLAEHGHGQDIEIDLRALDDATVSALHRATLMLAEATCDSVLPFTWRVLTPEAAPQAGIAPLSDPPIRELTAEIAQSCTALEGPEWRRAREQLRMLQAAARRALHAAEHADDALAFHALAAAMTPWWIELGAYDEGLYWFGCVGADSLSLDGSALRDSAWGALHLAAHEHGAAEPLLISAVAGLRMTQPRSRSLALALNQRGRLYQDLGRYEAAAADHSEASAIWERLDDRRNLLRSLNNQAVVAHDSGELQVSGALHLRSARIAAELGDARAAGVAISNLAVLHGSAGDLEKAQALTEAALLVWRRVGIVELQVVALNNLARFASERGAPETAGRYEGEAALLRRQVSPQAGLGLEWNAVLHLGARGFLPVCDVAEQMFE